MQGEKDSKQCFGCVGTLVFLPFYDSRMKGTHLSVVYRVPYKEGLYDLSWNRPLADGEFCYRNNGKSLFRKYNRLVTWLANTKRGREYLDLPDGEIALLTPNGYHEIITRDRSSLNAVFTVNSRPLYAPLLSPFLNFVDLYAPFVSSFEDMKHVLLFSMGWDSHIDFYTKYPRILFDSTTFYPNANPESTSVDGYVARESVSEAFSTIRGGSGTLSTDSTDGSDGRDARVWADTSSNNWKEIGRAITLWDTSSLPNTATLGSATASLYGNSKAGNQGSLTMVVASPASNTQLATSDYNIARWTMTAQSDTTISLASWSSAGYNDFPLNSTGLNNVSLTGVSKFGFVLVFDRDNTAPTWASNEDNRFAFYFADATGTSNDPKLVVNFTTTSTSTTTTTSTSTSTSTSTTKTTTSTSQTNTSTSSSTSTTTTTSTSTTKTTTSTSTTSTSTSTTSTSTTSTSSSTTSTSTTLTLPLHFAVVHGDV